MPAINVARTDTFEQQRQKINQIGNQIFNVTAGGSDLSTGNLKLGNGTIDSPSLAFSSEEKLGIFRSSLGVVSFVSSEKKIYDTSSEGLNLYKDINLEKKILSTPLLSITSSGQYYDPGSYVDIPVSGGTGEFGTLDITVSGITGNVTNSGSGYEPGSYNDVPLTGGSGTGITANITVDDVEIEVTNSGSGYVDGFYNDVPLIGGLGNGLEINFSVSDGNIVGVSISDQGSGYEHGDTFSIDNANVGGSGSGFSATITSFPGEVISCTIFGIGSNYEINDILEVNSNFDGVGSGSGLQFTITNAGFISSIDVNNPGIGYSQYDVLNVNSTDLTQPVNIVNYVRSVSILEFSTTLPSSTFSLSDTLRIAGGNLQSVSVTSSTDILGAANQTYTNISQSSTSGNGTGAGFTILRGFDGAVANISVTSSGYFYADGDTITIPGSSVGGSGPGDNIVVTVSSVTSSQQDIEIYKIITSGSNISYLITSATTAVSGSAIVKTSAPNTSYIIDTNTQKNKYFINTGSGEELTPDLTFYSGNRYLFNYSDPSNSSHPFNLSIHPDGTNNTVSGVTTTLVTGSNQFPVSSTSGILIGMLVEVATGNGVLTFNTKVTSVNGNTITISPAAVSGGLVDLDFSGVEYTDGVSKTSNSLSIKINPTTPNLYYYCSVHSDMGGEDGDEGLITIDLNNLKVFGSGFQVLVNNVLTDSEIYSDILSGQFNAGSFVSDSINATSGTLTTLNVSGSTTVNNLAIQTGITGTNISVTSSSLAINSNVSVGSLISISQNTGNITTSGVVKTTNSFNSNDKIKIQDNVISTISDDDIIISPFSSRLAKISGSSALVIPSGDILSRPGTGLRQNGAIRFNTDTNQYEGYNETSTSWSSLGGVRDIDGNTYILAELTAGANDNTLWFFNDNNNTIRLTTEFLDFRQVKKISSGKLGIPSFSEWAANTPVALGQYLKYRNNLYEVTQSGTTASSGSEPTHTSGATSNGTAELTWYSLAVGPLEFTEIEEVRIGPNKDCPLIVSSEIKLLSNTISTLVNDLVISPNPGKKVVINSTTHFAIPAGNDNQKSTATAQAGSIRYNTTISQFEGYSGTNWSSLGGVRDVDGNTYIIPETAPGENENILYFYNDGLNTLQLSKTSLDFTNIDTITTSGLATLALDTPLITLNSEDTTIDNTDLTRTFISTSKQYLDLGLSSGLVVDPVLRLDDQGDIYLNTGFGTGTYNGVKIFDGALKEFELADYAVKTAAFTLEKGVANTAAKNLYNTASAKGCQVSVIGKSSSGKKSLASYNVIDSGGDIFYNEFGSLNSSLDGFTASFDITPENETRITVTLSNDHANGDTVEFTIITQVYK